MKASRAFFALLAVTSLRRLYVGAVVDWEEEDGDEL